MRMTRVLVTLGIMLIMGYAMAGTLRCHVTLDGADVAGAMVTLTPGFQLLTTDGRGRCAFPGLEAGSYQVSAEVFAGSKLYGAIAAGVQVPAEGEAEVPLTLVRAIYISEYIPLSVGDRWEYRILADEPNVGPSESRRLDRVAAATKQGERDVMEMTMTWLDGSRRERSLVSVDGNGYAVYQQEMPEVLVTYDPPLGLPLMVPVGHEFIHQSTMKLNSEADGTQLEMRARLVGFERVMVPAGVFPDCARIDWRATGEATNVGGTLWLARGVGVVRARDQQDGYRSQRDLSAWRVKPVPELVLRYVPRPNQDLRLRLKK